MKYNKFAFTPDYIKSFLNTFIEITKFIINSDLDKTLLKNIKLSDNLNSDEDIRDIDGNSLSDGIIGQLYENNNPTGYFAIKKDGKINKLTKIEDNCFGIRYDFNEIKEIIKDTESNIEDVLIKIVPIHNKDRLCCFFTSQVEIDIKKLKLKLYDVLEKYKTPIFIQVDDWDNIPKPQLNTDMIKPTSDNETIVYECCCEVLGFDEFGITDDLNELGLTFYRKLKLNKLIYDKTEINIDAKDILRANTIQEIVEIISDIEFKQLLDF